MSWKIKIKNPDGSKHAFADNVTLTTPGVGNSANIPSRSYSCGHNHALTGTQVSTTKMDGTGVNPWPDPTTPPEPAKRPTGGVGPSWEATTGGPVPKP
jgi:hypothetical protein